MNLQRMFPRDLGHASVEQSGLLFMKWVYGQFGGIDRNNRHKWRRDRHGGAQGWADIDSDHGEHISNHSDDKKHNKSGFLHLWSVCKPQYKKLCHIIPILHVFHVMVNYITWKGAIFINELLSLLNILF